jgi:hypothetical protein
MRHLFLSIEPSNGGLWQDRLFTPWFFGQVGDQTNLCGGSDCTLDLWKSGVMDGEHAFMPNGNERSMQFAALYSSIGGGDNNTEPAVLPLGLYIGAHSPSADLMMLLMQGGYCPPPLPPGFKPNGYSINSTLRYGVDSGSAGGDLPVRRCGGRCVLLCGRFDWDLPMQRLFLSKYWGRNGRG